MRAHCVCFRGASSISRLAFRAFLMSALSMFVRSTYLETERRSNPVVFPLWSSLDSSLCFNLDFLGTNVIPQVSISTILLSQQSNSLPSFVLFLLPNLVFPTITHRPDPL
ncbi:hypothetical protein LZ30DRAFT_740989 [Colletotrichum cereale]|nr:hypothetical protein LZ30DRAFT_740989 [Colletotrichum cereale]